jgi:hypothetical protein
MFTGVIEAEAALRAEYSVQEIRATPGADEIIVQWRHRIGRVRNRRSRISVFVSAAVMFHGAQLSR